MKQIYTIYYRLVNYSLSVLFCSLSVTQGVSIYNNHTSLFGTNNHPEMRNQIRDHKVSFLTTKLTYDGDPIKKIKIQKSFLQNMLRKDLADLIISRYANIYVPKEIIFFIREYIKRYHGFYGYKTVFRNSPSQFLLDVVATSGRKNKTPLNLSRILKYCKNLVTKQVFEAALNYKHHARPNGYPLKGEQILELIQECAPILDIKQEWSVQLIKAEESDTEEDLLMLVYKKMPKQDVSSSKFFDRNHIYSFKPIKICDKNELKVVLTKESKKYSKNLMIIKEKYPNLKEKIFVLSSMSYIIPSFHPEYSVKKNNQSKSIKPRFAKDAAFIFPYYTKKPEEQYMQVEFIIVFLEDGLYLLMKTMVKHSQRAYFLKREVVQFKTKEKLMLHLYMQSFSYILTNKNDYDSKTQCLELPFHSDPEGLWETPQK